MAPVKTETSYKSPPSSISDTSQHENEPIRGRRHERERSSTAKAEEESAEEKAARANISAGGKPRKRKRSRKGLDKNFPCPHKDCGKSYSRAEHLYRHQLNHTPKRIYECDFPGCERQFVRQDLCTRHRERHTARGSHLQRKDPYTHTAEGRPTLPIPGAGQPEQFDPVYRPENSHTGTASSVARSSTTPHASPLESAPLSAQSPMLSRIGPQGPHTNHSAIPGDDHRLPLNQNIPRSSTMADMHRSHSDDMYFALSGFKPHEPSITNSAPGPRADLHQRHDHFEPLQSQNFLSRAPHSKLHSTSSPGSWRAVSNSYAPPTSQPYPSRHFSDSNNNGVYVRHQNFPPMLPLPPPVYPMSSQTTTPASQANFASLQMAETSVEPIPQPEMPSADELDHKLAEQSGAPYSAVPFDTDSYDRSPLAIPDDFAAWLFDSQHHNSASPGLHRQGSMSLGATAFMDESVNMPRVPIGPDEGMAGPYVQLQHPMAVTSIVDPSQAEVILSNDKWHQLLELIENRFNETDHAPVRKQKEALLDGNRDDPGHVLSLRMMQTYIGSYWYHFHPQMPILHKPTFSAGKSPNLLLVAIIAIGASCLDKVHGLHVTQAGAELSNFLALHLRFEIFKDKDFIPPAKLWVFQALLLLEIYEKMYSTRMLHERAHIHHGTTLTLMRRGSSLIGRSALDSPPSGTDGKVNSVADSQQHSTLNHTPDQWWNHWITNEATRRVAFAAFIIDSIHATMFGHSATMVAHEMKLQLPCDESLWSATSSAEVGRIEKSLQERGIKPISFFDGLKATLNSKSVRTNPFGRTALMAGLLSVSWHMNQRDQQVRTLGALKALGGKDVWRGTLTKAFDFWKSDFDQSVSNKSATGTSAFSQLPDRLDEENIFESRTVLHHLSHMATHVDIVSCQIFARAERLLGRTTLDYDFAVAQKRIREHWAPKPSARDATFYSLKFLAQVLTPDTAGLKRSASEAGMGGPTTYSARDDFLINRPWVVYVAALIVWSYGYALDGPIASPPSLITSQQKTYDMRLYLERVGGVDVPDDLMYLRDRNACMGMLYVLQEMLGNCRWQLLREGAKLLGKCINMLQGLPA
ncbi:MAG: hypothetical protein LQ351_003760 [Letrouitia transgressa]|nr:MAG: hypothetical protein LQ351_003760 [Letrouitia transgressa]